MYKFLPILLFAFLVAEIRELSTGEFYYLQSDSLDLIWAEEQLGGWVISCNKKLSNIIDKEKFAINIDTELYDVMRMDTSYNHILMMQNKFRRENKTAMRKDTSYQDIVSTKLAEMENNYPPENRHRFYVNYGRRRDTKLAVIKLLIEVNVDKSIELDKSYKKAILGVINTVFFFADLDIDDIIFNSVDISKLKSNNNQLSLNRDDIYDDSWAVIIGIDEYQNLSNLDYAVADAEAVKNMLINKFNYKEGNVNLLLNEEANKTNIVNVISDVSLKAGENDRILVFFAGHGETMDLPAGGEMGFLLPVDGNENNLYASAVRMDDLKDLSYLSKSKHMLFLVDACYGGLAAVGTRSLEPTKTPNYLEKISNIKSRQIITAGGKEEKVVEKSIWGHSAYTKNLLSGLNDELADINEDGYITALELGSYLSEKVTFDSEGQQTPQLRRLTSDEGEFVFFSNHRANKPNVVDQVRKSSGDDIVEEKAVDEKKSYFEKFGYESRAIGFVAFEDIYQIAFSEDMNNNWNFTIMYMQIGNNSLKNYITSHNSHSITANVLAVRLGYKYYITDNISPYIALGTGYMMSSWEDTVQKTSGDKNIILYGGGVGVGVFPFQFEQPFPMNVGFIIGVVGEYLPSSYAVDDGIVTLEDWKITLMPVVSLYIGFPK